MQGIPSLFIIQVIDNLWSGVLKVSNDNLVLHCCGLAGMKVEEQLSATDIHQSATILKSPTDKENEVDHS